MTRQTASSLPRVGLLGNPSDGYGGKVIAFTFLDFRARVSLEDAERPRIVTPTGTVREAEDPAALAASLAGDRTDGTELPRAALARFLSHAAAGGEGPAAPLPGAGAARFALRFHSDIPRQVGLAGSSAIVVATLRALAARFLVPLPPTTLAALALAAETEELGITAGPQDRVVQAHEGLLFMDFGAPRGETAVHRLDPSLLPPLYLAWSASPGASSGEAHRTIRRRFEAGDPEIRAGLAVFPRLAEEGRDALLAGDHGRLCALLDENFAARAAIWPLRPEDRDLVRIGREAGAAVKLAGSGGGVVGIPHTPDAWPRLERAHREAGFPFLRPRPGNATGGERVP